jgi:hypothetical protein
LHEIGVDAAGWHPDLSGWAEEFALTDSKLIQHRKRSVSVPSS